MAGWQCKLLHSMIFSLHCLLYKRVEYSYPFIACLRRSDVCGERREEARESRSAHNGPRQRSNWNNTVLNPIYSLLLEYLRLKFSKEHLPVLGGNLWWTSIPSRGREQPSRVSRQAGGRGISSGSVDQLGPSGFILNGNVSNTAISVVRFGDISVSFGLAMSILRPARQNTNHGETKLAWCVAESSPNCTVGVLIIPSLFYAV